MILPRILYKAGVISVVLMALSATATKINLKTKRTVVEHTVSKPASQQAHPLSAARIRDDLAWYLGHPESIERREYRIIDDDESIGSGSSSSSSSSDSDSGDQEPKRYQALKVKSSALASTPSSESSGSVSAAPQRSLRDPSDVYRHYDALQTAQPVKIARKLRIKAIVQTVKYAAKWIKGDLWKDLEKGQSEPPASTPRIKGVVMNNDRILYINHLEGTNGLHGLKYADVDEALGVINSRINKETQMQYPAWVLYLDDLTGMTPGMNIANAVSDAPITRVALYSSKTCAEQIAKYEAPSKSRGFMPERCAVIHVVCKGEVRQGIEAKRREFKARVNEAKRREANRMLSSGSDQFHFFR